MNKDKLYVISFDKVFYDSFKEDKNPFTVPMVALFNINTISKKEARKVIKAGEFVYEHDSRLVVMTMEQYKNLCK